LNQPYYNIFRQRFVEPARSNIPTSTKRKRKQNHSTLISYSRTLDKTRNGHKSPNLNHRLSKWMRYTSWRGAWLRGGEAPPRSRSRGACPSPSISGGGAGGKHYPSSLPNLSLPTMYKKNGVRGESRYSGSPGFSYFDLFNKYLRNESGVFF
jgi:hypothetical protein